MLTDELVTRKLQLEGEIAELQAKVDPLQRTLDQKRELLGHISRALELETGRGPGADAPPPLVDAIGARPPTWAQVARERGLKVGGDSAHRVVARLDAQLHASTHAAQGTQCEPSS